MDEIRLSSSTEGTFKIRLPMDLLRHSEFSAPKPTLNQHSLRVQKVYPIFLQLEQTIDGYEICDRRSKKSKPKQKQIEEVYKCTLDDCNKEFPDAVALRKHQNIHNERQYLCPVESCGRQFLDNSKLRRHMLVHTGEKPFRCEFCSKCFSLDFNLKTHLRIHTGEKPYQCSFQGCMKRFTQSSNLTAHERTHYLTDTEIKTRTIRPAENDMPIAINSANRQPFSLELPSFEIFTAAPAILSTNALPMITGVVSTSALPMNDDEILS